MLSFAKIPTARLWTKTTSIHQRSSQLCYYSFNPLSMSFGLISFRNAGKPIVDEANRVICDSEQSANFSTMKCKCYTDGELLHIAKDDSVTEESTPSMMMTRKNPPSSSFLHLAMRFRSQINILLLCGFSIFRDPQMAVAATVIPSQLQTFSFLGDLDDISTGFVSGFLLIFFSELGDKTFFIAALLAARNSPAVVFLGTFGALAVMTVISAVLGRTFHYLDDILPFRFGGTDLPVDDLAAVVLLVYFGATTLLDASSSDSLKAEEEKKEAEVAVSNFSGDGAGILASANTIISTFLLVFVAEWGDKSFFSTIALAAASSPLGVIVGALAGHGVATLLAVLGGSLLGSFLSEKVIAYIGGTLFLVFAAVTLIEIVN